MKKKSTIIPLLLLIYLSFMSIYFGWPEYSAGNISALYFYGVIGATLLVIILLHLSLKKRDRLRRERESDMNQ